jgi:hypothetical protein
LLKSKFLVNYEDMIFKRSLYSKIMKSELTKSSVRLGIVFHQSLVMRNYEEYDFTIKVDDVITQMSVLRKSFARHYHNHKLPGYFYWVEIGGCKLNYGFFKSRRIFKKVNKIFNTSEEELRDDKIKLILL